VENIIHPIAVNEDKTSEPSYVGLDIGSCEGIDAARIFRLFPHGRIIQVDPNAPYSIGPDVVKADGETFIATSTRKYDFILVKYTIHFIRDQTTFIQNCIDALNPGGKLYIFSADPETTFPWSPKLQIDFENSCAKIQEQIQNNEYGYWKSSKIQKLATLTQKEFANFIKFRGISNLKSYSEAEIENELYMIEGKKGCDFPISIVINQYIFYKS
jgi:SAM-dependent methyltransferase